MSCIEKQSGHRKTVIYRVKVVAMTTTKFRNGRFLPFNPTYIGKSSETTDCFIKVAVRPKKVSDFCSLITFYG